MRMTAVTNGVLLCSIWYRFGFLDLFDATSPERYGVDRENGRHVQPQMSSECVTVRGAVHDCQPIR
jgi:hypothetical protein